MREYVNGYIIYMLQLIIICCNLKLFQSSITIIIGIVLFLLYFVILFIHTLDIFSMHIYILCLDRYDYDSVVV